MKTIRDGLLGDLAFESLELEIMDTALFQRLRGIKQLGTSSLVYPSAVHTRFEHSLGTCHWTQVMLDQLHQKGWEISPFDRQTLRIAALLHDITHVPFGHTFEDERRIFPRHDQSEKRFAYFFQQSEIASILNREGLLAEVGQILSSKKNGVSWKRQLISGTLCADLLDYLRRDAAFCGLKQDYDERFLKYLNRDEEQLYFDIARGDRLRPDALSEMINCLRLRYNLTERVYYHHAKIASGAMISKALEMLLEERDFSEENLWTMRDDVLLHTLCEEANHISKMKGLVEGLLSRKLYKTAFLMGAPDARGVGISQKLEESLEQRFHLNRKGERKAFEKECAKELGCDESAIIVYCPEGRMALKEAQVNISLPHTQDRCTLASLQLPELKVLMDKHRQLWSFRVLCAPEIADQKDQLNKICREKLGLKN